MIFLTDFTLYLEFIWTQQGDDAQNKAIKIVALVFNDRTSQF